VDRAALVYRQVREIPLLYVALEEIVCPLLLAADVRDGLSCGVARPVIDRRTFQYGWEIYAVDAMEPVTLPRPGGRPSP
jgi:hypothetical protein